MHFINFLKHNNNNYNLLRFIHFNKITGSIHEKKVILNFCKYRPTIKQTHSS